MTKPKQKGAGKGKDTGNVTIDLGETIEKKLRAAGLTGPREQMGKGSTGKTAAASWRPGMFGGRSGSFGGYQPWYSRSGRPWLGQGAEVTAFPMPGGRTAFTLIPQAIAQVKTTEVLTGVGLGIVGNRALVRLTPLVWKGNTSRILHEGLAFIAGLIPIFIKRNATTLGVALPGAVYLGGTIVDMLFDAIHMPANVLKGSQQGSPQVSGADAANAARQKLAAIQQRIQHQPAPVGQVQRPLPRVVAQPQYA
jgi:hypothetical protein